METRANGRIFNHHDTNQGLIDGNLNFIPTSICFHEPEHVLTRGELLHVLIRGGELLRLHVLTRGKHVLTKGGELLLLHVLTRGKHVLTW